MFIICRNIILGLFCGLFMMHSIAAAQGKPTTPNAGKPETGKTEKIEKSDKIDKTDKAPNGLAPITLEDLAINFPDVEGWEKSEIQKYPTEDMGFSINYESKQGGKVTIYVYNGGNKKIADGAGDKLIQKELDKAKGEIQKVADLGYYPNLQELKGGIETLGKAGKNKVLYALYNFGPEQQTVTSEIYIFGNQNRFVKIRATRLRDKNEAGNKMVADLLKELDTFFSS